MQFNILAVRSKAVQSLEMTLEETRVRRSQTQRPFGSIRELGAQRHPPKAKADPEWNAVVKISGV